MSQNSLKNELLETLGPSDTNRVVQRHRRLAYIPDSVLENLASEALTESWGDNLYALEKYIAVNTPWAIEQDRFTATGDQFYVSAGHLRTRYGTPIYLVYERNRVPDRQPFVLKHASASVAAPEYPDAPSIPAGADAVPIGREIVMQHDHMLRERADRVPFLSDTPPVAQMCAVAGAIQWSLNRRLQWRYWYYGRMDYLVPLYLKSREDITSTPDVVAPVQIRKDSLLVRTLLLPHQAYANARVGVERHDQLPTWLLAGWAEHAASTGESEIDDPEAAAE